MTNTKVLMCRPDYFDVLYEINPWMTDQIGRVNFVTATDQWTKLYDSIAAIAEVKLINSVENLPDLVFTANAGFVSRLVAIISRFAKIERQSEERYTTHWFIENNYHTINIDSYYEGAGDHLVDHRGRHWLGTGFRTELAARPELSKILDVNINTLELVDDRWYHLDTCFCPLSGGELLWYPPAFSASSQQLIRRSFDYLIDVSVEDAKLFACNTVCIDKNIFISTNEKTSEKLDKLGYNVNEFRLGEFMKAGGAAKCLVLTL